MLIAGDIGATKTLLALYTPEAGARAPLLTAEFPSADYPGLAELVRELMTQTKRPIETACFDVAGPVIGGRAHLTNLPWLLEEESLRQTLGLQRVMLLNDLNAVAYAVPHLQPDELHTINAGTPVSHGSIAVIAPGTGLGEAFLVWDGGKQIACPSEGGHSDFAPANTMQAELWEYLFKRYGHVANERLCSGRGLPNIYDFLRDTGRGAETPAFAAALSDVSDRTPLIVQAALGKPADALCSEALDIFVSILGAEAGNLALKVLANSGVYLAGGIPPRIISRLDDGRFMQAFVSKSRFVDLLRNILVNVIITEAALFGAALYGLNCICTGA